MAAFKDEHSAASEYYQRFVKPGQSFNLTCDYMWLYHNFNVNAMEILRKIKELFKEYKLEQKGWCDFAVEETVLPSYNQDDFKFRYLFSGINVENIKKYS